MTSDQVLKLIGDQFDRPSNVHGKTGPKSQSWLDRSTWLHNMFALSQYVFYHMCLQRQYKT